MLKNKLTSMYTQTINAKNNINAAVQVVNDFCY